MNSDAPSIGDNRTDMAVAVVLSDSPNHVLETAAGIAIVTLVARPLIPWPIASRLQNTRDE
ncbi:hypothetical protein DPMN_102102 [Dreissena polymorpha]|uniref:Uncharacterized protein n=1 Tax=Dreissena polymorpha TaxID=45954 RepID=A0A9D4RAA8_DREPO|nr:hypothetical protein DPMN_102102 [Dreissena polymorpha]